MVRYRFKKDHKPNIQHPTIIKEDKKSEDKEDEPIEKPIEIKIINGKKVEYYKCHL